MPAALRRLRDESFTLRRVATRLGRRSPRAALPQAPERPVGAKLEVTYACNLRCGFCYTDSPRHTLARTPELDDAGWLAVAEEVDRLGVIEAVITGGEPLLRRDLTLSLLDRLGAAGIGCTLNTNGWFVDDAVAAHLATVPDLHVHVSIDGAAPELHDAARGVPGSWRRAVAAVDRLLDHGVQVHVVHVVTPANEAHVGAFLDRMWLLGVPSLRITPVVGVGAAARGGRWRTDLAGWEREVADFRRARGEAMRVMVQPGTSTGLAVRQAPAALLVRPDGRVRMDSMHPFAFGDAVGDGLDACWMRIREGWEAPEIRDWAGALHSGADLPRSGVVPYLDDEVDLSPAGASRPVRPRRDPADVARAAAQPLPAPAPPRDDLPLPAALAAARGEILALALARRHRLGPVRWSGGRRDRWVRRTDTGAVLRLNATAIAAMDVLATGSGGEAVEALAARHPGVPQERLVDDVVAIMRRLRDAGVLVPERARGPVPAPRADAPGPDLPVAG